MRQVRSVAVVTDSSSGLRQPAGAGPGRPELRVLPLQLIFSGQVWADDESLPLPELLAILAAGGAVTTSRPSPRAFEELYRELADAGVDQILSIHVSGGLSGTVGAARLAASAVRAEVEVTVFDSRTLGAALGRLAHGAVLDLGAGLNFAETCRRLRWRAEHAGGWVVVDDLAHLRRGGRVPAISALIGGAIGVRPVLQLVGGTFQLRARARGTQRALERMLALAKVAPMFRDGWLAVQHLGAVERASWVVEQLGVVGAGSSGAVGAVEKVEVLELPASLAAHTGLGMVGLMMVPEPPNVVGRG